MSGNYVDPTGEVVDDASFTQVGKVTWNARCNT